MANQTTNYNLNKPVRGERNYDVLLNENADIIDTHMKANENKIGNLSNLTTSNKTDLVSAVNENVASLAEKASQTDVNNALGLKADKTTTDNLQSQVSSLASGAPKAVSLVSEMTDTTKNYVYTGTENGYTSGNWYYWNGSAWVSGGVYQSAGIANNSVGKDQLKTMKWGEISGSNKYINFNTETKTVSLTSDVYVYNDDGYVNAKAGTISYTDANANYLCVDKTTGNIFMKDISTATTVYAYILCRIQDGKIYSPNGYQNITINGAKPTSTNVTQELVISSNSLEDNAITTSKIADNAVTILKLKSKKWAEIMDGAVYLDINTVDKTATLTGNRYIWNDDGYVTAIGGTISFNNANTVYICVNRATGVLFTQDISQPTSAYAFILCRISTNGKVYSPYGYKQIRVNGAKPNGSNTDFELPDNSIPREKLNFSIDPTSRKRLYTLADAWSAWQQGRKFPVAFMGDSTTESDTTSNPPDYNTLGTDHISEGSYSLTFENMVKAVTGNNIMRIYNAGFSSRNAVWGLANIDAMIKNNTHYADVKMIGIRYGLNDPLESGSTTEYIDSMRNAMRGIIDWCFTNNIQPFLITPQATMMAYRKYSPAYTSAEITNISLSVIRELAQEYNLELIDNYAYTKMLQMKIDNIASLVPDGLHYKTEGHTYQAGLLFAEFNKETIKVGESRKIGYVDPEVRSDIAEASKLSSRINGYTSRLTTTLAGKVFKANIFNHFKYGITLDFHFTTTVPIIVKVNDVDYTLDETNHVVTVNGMGLIKIEVVNTDTNSLTFYGVEIS